MEILIGIASLLVIIQISLMLYSRRADGTMTIQDGEDGIRRFSLELDRGPEDLEDKNVIRFRVVRK